MAQLTALRGGQNSGPRTPTYTYTLIKIKEGMSAF